jgi:hypothetical protein
VQTLSALLQFWEYRQRDLAKLKKLGDDLIKFFSKQKFESNIKLLGKMGVVWLIFFVCMIFVIAIGCGIVSAESKKYDVQEKRIELADFSVFHHNNPEYLVVVEDKNFTFYDTGNFSFVYDLRANDMPYLKVFLQEPGLVKSIELHCKDTFPLVVKNILPFKAENEKYFYANTLNGKISYVSHSGLFYMILVSFLIISVVLCYAIFLLRNEKN